MNTLSDKLTKSQIDLSIELRLANGSSAEFYESDKERVQEALRLLGAPRLFAQPHLLLASPHWASIIPCKGIDMILVHTSAPLPLKFPVEIPAGLFDIVEQPDDWPDNKSATCEDQIGQPRRRQSQVEIHALGGWTVTLAAVAMFLGNAQDERQFLSQLPNMPTIPFRLKEGGFGLINTANIMRVSVWPKPETFPGSVLPFARTERLRRANSAAGTSMLRR